MALVKIDKLQQGMVVSEDVRDISERLLLSKGVEIGDQHIRILKMWGVFEIEVDTAGPMEVRESSSLDSEQAGAVSQALSRKFSNLDLAHPVIREILKLSIERRLVHPVPTEPKPPIQPQPESNPQSFKEILQKIDRIEVQLPEVPSLVFELNEIIADPMSTAGDIAQVVNQSPSLTATLLKIVNSAYYGFRSKIDSISRAIMLIGSNEVSNLALGITIMETFRDIPKQILDVASFLEHSLSCGIVARLLAAHAKINQTEQIFVSGMLHDIGRLILCKYFPQAAKAMFEEAVRTQQSLYAVERAMIGTTHTQIGRKLLTKWKLPYTLENNVYYHHNPAASPQPQLAAAVMLADIIVHGLDMGSSGEQKIPSFHAQAWQSMKLPVGAIKPVIEQALGQLENLRQVMPRE